MTSFIPESAPFNEEQRAWLNGFFAGLAGMNATENGEAILQAQGLGLGSSVAVAEEEEEDFPWHDAGLPIVDRMELAQDKPVERKLMAAMAQLDCGSCGYLCQTYSEAIASGEEKNLTLCSPGGKETKQMIKKILAESSTNGEAQTNGTAGKPTANDSSAAQWSRNNPYSARLLESRKLNKEGSAKDTRHVVIDLAGSGMTYNVGDALGILPTNCGDLAARVIDAMAADSQVTVSTPLGNTKPLLQALCEDCCLKDPSDELLELLVGRVSDSSAKETLREMLENGVPDGFDVLDVFEVAKKVTVTATEVLETLEPLNPRLYSIASSMKKVGNEVHLTVGKVMYEREDRIRKGVASTMLAERVAIGESVRVFIQPNHAGFTVPPDDSKPMIMVGPGTGIAPFVAFLQEREATKANGKNWLFFGDQHEAFDFLYEEELRAYQKSGLLSHLDTAFSRDGDAKVYVQDRMRARGAELWDWLEQGASFFVCGDASRMASDVDRALRGIIEEHGKMTSEQASAYVAQMGDDGRYERDIY